MKKLKIGDKVRFVGPAIHTISYRVWFEAPKGYVGTVAKADPTGKIYLMIEDCKEACTIHRRQVTHRIVKKKRREFWILEAMIPHLADDVATTDVSKNYPGKKYIHVREVVKRSSEANNKEKE